MGEVLVGDEMLSCGIEFPIVSVELKKSAPGSISGVPTASISNRLGAVVVDSPSIDFVASVPSEMTLALDSEDICLESASSTVEVNYGPANDTIGSCG